MVVDTSALLAVFFAEPHGEWVAARLAEHAPELRMSTVNLTETLIQPISFKDDRIKGDSQPSPVRSSPPLSREPSPPSYRPLDGI